MEYDVCVIGCCSIDYIYYEKKNGGYPTKADKISLGGKGANQAVAASRAGAKTIIITKIGKDKIGKSIIRKLKHEKINTDYIELEKNVNNNYSKIYIDYKTKENKIERYDKISNLFDEKTIEKNKKIILNSKIIICELKVPKKVVKYLINFCYENNKKIILTPSNPQEIILNNKENIELIKKVNVITCNQEECEIMFNTKDIEKCVTLYPNKLIVTLGNNGLIYSNDKEIIKLNAIKTKVIDTTGAGDTLNGTLSALLSRNEKFNCAVQKAMIAASMKLSSKTAQKGMPYIDQLEKFIINNHINID